MDIRGRYLERQVLDDLDRKMVFLAGPREVGKTTLARRLPGGPEGYLSWDVPAHRERILERELPSSSSLWVFDEIHKYRRWRDYLKGLCDDPSLDRRILVTGSARLEYYRYSGDSLQGRYHLLRLHPYSVAELGIGDREGLADLLRLGGFPEPFESGSETQARRWSREYRNLLLREEVASLERVTDLGTLELLVLRLPDRVGSPLSLNALREDLAVSHRTVQNWIEILSRLYAVFRLSPFGAPRLRAVKKAQKHYQLDWTLVPEDGPRFENLVACHLLKWVHYEQDARGRELELRYFRDRDGREVDFVVTESRRPILLVECKWDDRGIDRGLRYLCERVEGADAWQISAVGTRDYVAPGGIRVAPATTFLRTLV